MEGNVAISLSDIKDMAEVIANVVSNEVMKDLQGFHYKIIAGAVGALVSAIVYMYLSHKSETKKANDEKSEAYGQIFAIIEENARLNEQVKNDLNTVKESSKKVEKTVEDMDQIVSGCKNRRKGNDEL